MLYTIFSSPLGEIVINTDGTHLAGFRFIGQRYFDTIPSEWQEDFRHPVLVETLRQTKEYFDGARKEFDLPLIADGTPFQKEVWQELMQIPYGTCVTYGVIAERVGMPKAVRAVGTAIGRNPLCVVVPCHRVVSAQGAMAGYAGGIERKEKLLKLESTLLV